MMVTIVVLLHSCTKIALIGGATTIAVSQNPYVKVYGGTDILTIMHTEKDIKGHVYEAFKGKNEHE